MVTQPAQPAPPKFNVNTPFKDLLMSDRFNCTDAVATALIGQGLSSVDVFLTINEDDVDSIVKTIRKPATGTGEDVSYLTVKSLKATIFGVNRYHRNALYRGLKPVPLNDLKYDARLFNDKDILKVWAQYALQAKERKDIETDINVKDAVSKRQWAKVFETLDNYIAGHYSSTTKVSLVLLCTIRREMMF